MRVSGNHQTTFADWARAVITHYPYELTYELDQEDTVHVFNGELEVAHYDFGHGNGGMEDTPPKNITDIGSWPSFQEISIDNMMYPVDEVAG